MGLFDKFKKKQEPNKSLTFSERWSFYRSKKEDLNYFIRFDMSIPALSDEVRAKYPHILELIVPYERAEMEKLNAIEDSFSVGAYDVKFIAALTDNSNRVFVFCFGGTEDNADKIADTLMSASGGANFSAKVFLDSAWSYHEKIIAPTVYENNWMSNDHLCRHLENNGEAFKEPRVIDFYIVFEGKTHVQSVSNELEKLGFSIVNCTREGGRELLSFTLEAVPEFDFMDEITDKIIALLDGTDGNFDGWGCPIMKEE